MKRSVWLIGVLLLGGCDRDVQLEDGDGGKISGDHSGYAYLYAGTSPSNGWSSFSAAFFPENPPAPLPMQPGCTAVTQGACTLTQCPPSNGTTPPINSIAAGDLTVSANGKSVPMVLGMYNQYSSSDDDTVTLSGGGDADLPDPRGG